MEAERARQAEEGAHRQVTLLHDVLESIRSGDNPHLALHQLQLLHRLPLESVLSLQAQLCSCLHAVEQVGPHTHVCMQLRKVVCSDEVVISDFPWLRLPRWFTESSGSAAWRVERRAQCHYPVATDYNARAAPRLQSARSALNKLCSSRSPDLIGPPPISDQSFLIPQIPALDLNHHWKLQSFLQRGNKKSTDLVLYF